MYKDTVQLDIDRKALLKTNRVQAKRPSEHWIAFLKKYTFKRYWGPKRHLSWLLLIPFLITAYALYDININGIDGEDYVGWFVTAALLFVFLIIYVGSLFMGSPMVEHNTFDNLAKFIMNIKGDIAQNMISVNLDISEITEDKYAIDFQTLGIIKDEETTYKPYQMERYLASFRLKDTSFCMVSLHQICLETTNTKRRSSGKIKSKTKYKHKLYYVLSLKLNKNLYTVVPPEALLKQTGPFEISIRTENEFHLVKLKYKEKLLALNSEISEAQRQKPSIFTEMMEGMFTDKIVIRNANTLLTP